MKKRKGDTNCSIALSHTGSALAKPLTSLLVLLSKSPFMNDMVLQIQKYCKPKKKKKIVNIVGTDEIEY